jgi:hypothetical protein
MNSYIRDVAEAIRLELDPDLLPDMNADLLFLIYAVLALSKGEAVTRRDVHDAWSAWMEASGEPHASLVPFDQLDPATQDEDEPFVAAIRRVAARR